MEQKVHLTPMQIFSFQILLVLKKHLVNRILASSSETAELQQNIRPFFVNFLVQYIQFVL